MIRIDNETVVVFTPAELSDAISVDNGIDYVYLGENIIMTSGIRIHPAKTTLVIDGIFPPDNPVFHTLTDSGNDTGQIFINASQLLDLTFQNLIIAGRNYYGVPRVYDYSGAENVTVTYRNVTYTGPQMTWNVRGLARYIDCDITIQFTGYSGMQEVAEINRVEIGGKTRIRHNSSGYAVFYFYKANPYFKVIEDADVEISSAYDFFYNEGIYYVPFTISPRARFTLTTNRGISRDSGHRAASVLVDKDASFRYIRNTNNGSAHAFYVNGAFTVNEGASVYMQANFASTGSLIRFASSSSGLYVNNPKSFVLYNAGTSASAAALSFTATTQFTLSGGQLNYWENATAFPAAGTFDDTPFRKWNRPDWSPFMLRGTATSSQTSITSSDFTPDELTKLPALSDLQLHTARVLSIGNLPLAVNTVVLGRPITGTTEPDANVKIEYTSAGTPYSLTDIADGNGLFSIIALVPVPLAADVAVSANTPFLIVWVTKTSQEDGELSLLSVPAEIVFKTRPIATDPLVLLPRLEPDAPVVVSDTRADKTQWQLWAKITGPLKTDDDDVLTGAVVFVPNTGDLIVLDTDSVWVHTDGPYVDPETPVVWDESKGVLAYIGEPVRSGKKYSTQLIWEVRPS